VPQGRVDFVPLCVPAEVFSPAEKRRCFRLALEISESGLRLRSPIETSWQRKVLRVRLVLPPPSEEVARLFPDEWDGHLHVCATAKAEVSNPGLPTEKEVCRLLVFERHTLDPSMSAKIARYVTLRQQAG